MNKKVALALASGGPRGFAYIGAIEELLDRGNEISSVAGVSAGSLVGGIYAAGGLQAFKEWLFGLDPVKVVALMDFSVSKNYLVKGEKVISAIKERVPDVNIEDLPIPFTAVATDLYTGEEVIFREGPLFDAIRASISIPSMFKPAQIGGRTLVDGGMVNTFPLNRVERTPGDILVGFNVNQIDAAEIQGFNRGIVERAERIGTSPHNDAEEIFQADAVLHDFMDHSGSRNLRKRAVGETVHSHLVHGYVIQGLHLGFGQAAVNLAFRENGSFRREQAGIQVKRGADAMRIENGNQLLILLDTVVITEGQRKKPTVRKTNIHGSSSP